MPKRGRLAGGASARRSYPFSPINPDAISPPPSICANLISIVPPVPQNAPPRDLTRALQKLLGDSAVLSRPEDLILYEYDGSVEKGRPDLVVFPSTTAEVSQIVRIAAQYNIPILGRGAGT